MMKSPKDVEKLEKLIGQLNGLHAEISVLAKKSPNDGINLFKMKFVNSVLANANDLLISGYRPFEDFSQFSEHPFPTNSDVTLILAQYMEQVERFRSDHIQWSSGNWVYILDGKPSDIEAKQPTKIGTTRD